MGRERGEGWKSPGNRNFSLSKLSSGQLLIVGAGRSGTPKVSCKNAGGGNTITQRGEKGEYYPLAGNMIPWRGGGILSPGNMSKLVRKMTDRGSILPTADPQITF